MTLFPSGALENWQMKITDKLVDIANEQNTGKQEREPHK